MSDATLVQQLAAATAEVRFDDLPEAVRHSAPQRVLDVIGLGLAALDLDTSAGILALVAEQGGRPEATALGLTDQVPSAQAALSNGVLAHSLDYDDTHLPSVLHPSASVVPAALAVAEAQRSTGAELLSAVTVGVEVCVRLGMAGFDRDAGQSTFFERGQHATSICGALGAAAASAKLRGVSIADAIGIAASMGSGVIEANRTGGTVKRMHCGWAAHSGVLAAALVAHGFTGPPTVLEGRFGFFEAWLSGQFEASEITAGLGSSWCLADVTYKPYPANHFTHAVADAAIRLREEGLRPTDISAVEVGVATPTVRTVGEPLADKRRPESGYHAKFSAPYVFTAALLGGSGLGLGLDDFSDAVALTPERFALMDRVTVVGSAWADERYPFAFPAEVTVTLTDGTVRTARVADNRGSPARPLTDTELVGKFRDNAARALGGGGADELAVRILNLASNPDVRTLLKDIA